MEYTFTTPRASRASDRPAPVDDALIAAVRRVLHDAIGALPLPSNTHPYAHRELFASGVRTLCLDSRRAGVPVEKLIVALKQAWAATPELRIRFGETSSDALTTLVTDCIETYFLADPNARTG